MRVSFRLHLYLVNVAVRTHHIICSYTTQKIHLNWIWRRWSLFFIYCSVVLVVAPFLLHLTHDAATVAGWSNEDLIWILNLDEVQTAIAKRAVVVSQVAHVFGRIRTIEWEYIEVKWSVALSWRIWSVENDLLLNGSCYFLWLAV